MKVLKFAGPMLICALLLAVGCDSPHEKVQKKLIAIMNDYCDALSSIKSNADLVDAKPKLEKLGGGMKDVANEAKDLPKPSADEEKKLEKEFEADTKKVGERIQKEMERLTTLGVSPMELMDSMKFIPETMGK